MAISLSNFLYPLLLLLIPASHADTVTYDMNVGWTTANPDGQHERRVIGINGHWPPPLLNITKGDRVIVNLHNQLGDQGTSVHFHGLYQNGSTNMDGPVGATQCNIPAGHSMTYNFTVDQPGTYWYHSHTRGQYPDGWRGQFVVHDPENPYAGQYDEEVPMTLSDWYHDEMPGLIDFFMSYKNPTGAEPVPYSALMNDTQNLTISVKPGQTYFFRMTNIGAFAGQYFWIEGHKMKIIEVDGVYTEPAEADMIYLTAAQRYGFLVTAKEDASKNFAMVSSMDESLFDSVPSYMNPNVTGWLMYDDSAPKPKPALVDEFRPFDDITLVPDDGKELLTDVKKRIRLDMTMANLGDGANYAWFNNVTYTAPVVPSLYTALSAGDLATTPAVYGDYTNAYVLNKGDVVEIILNNNDGGKHPFHLHGHDFQAIWRAEPNTGFYNPVNESNFPAKPMRRDTFMVRPMGNFVIRFKADNPGLWLFHCHLDWHLVSGLVATMIEAPLELQKTLTIPEDHFEVCRAQGVPYKGNAAGNTVNYLNLDGQNKMPAPLPAGFTARGIVALVFSAVSAFLGMAAIAWYGAAPLGSAELASAQRWIAKAGGSTK